MTLLLMVLLPLFGAFLPAVFDRWGRNASALGAGTLTLASLLMLLGLAPSVLRGEPIVQSVAWLPALGLSLTFLLDGLSLLFGLLVLGIGLLVVIYARYYLSSKDSMGRFLSFLLLFMGAMLGVVLSGNLLLTAIFWELTSVSSFLLIGFWSGRADARRGARMALTVTGTGGLALLGGVVLLGQIAGTYELRELLTMREAITSHALYLPALCLVLLGAFTKSAQFPFHFWLPQAMAAPTPVSSYLHSATMVKAGVFLIARLHPALGGTEAWFYLVAGAGLLTMLVGALLANLAYDLKGLLAYSTVSHLGLIVALLGFGTEAAIVAALFHVLNHAAFKASLFMLAGIVDHEAGTRDLRELGGLRRLMPISAALTVVAGASMAGLPPLNGFLSKELFLEETLHLPFSVGPWWVVPALATIGATLSVGYAARLVHGTFFGAEPATFPHPPHDPPAGMTLPVGALVTLCVAVGLAPDLLAAPLIEVAASASHGALTKHVHFALWHGWTLPLLMSAIAVGVGALVWRGQPALIGAIAGPLSRIAGKTAFDNAIAGIVGGARALRAALHPGRLQDALAWAFVTSVVVVLPALLLRYSAWPSARDTFAPELIAGVVMLVIATAGVVRNYRRRVVSVIYASVIGLLISLGFVYLSAPDLALTQLAVEVATLVLLLLALHLLPAKSPVEAFSPRIARDAVIALAVGAMFAVFTWMLLADPIASESSAYYLANSKSGGGGTNVVNVILVDFRGFDTFGEGTVLGIAALGVYALIDGLGLPAKWLRNEPDDEAGHPLMLVVVARLLLPLALMVALYLFLRGHNQPGGGFVAGLVVASAIILQYLASGIGWTQQRMRLDFHPLIAAGILIAGLTGAAAWVFDRPFLTSWYDYFHYPPLDKFELASAAGFDLGVFLTVVGALLLVLVNLGKLPASARVRDVLHADEEV